MRRGIVAFSALAFVGLVLTGCGMFRFDQREPWRIQAEEACLQRKLVQPTAYMALQREIAGPGACGISYPFRIAAFAGGSVGVQRQVTLACPIIPSVDGWLNEVVQPAAYLYFGSPVVELKSGSYACRGRNGARSGRLSEHSFGNAVDVSAFRLADGREVTIVRGWRGAPDEQEFLREVFVGACRYFTTVLGPGADAFHYDHFHLDLARHDPRWERRICKPALRFAPRIVPGQTPLQTAARPVPQAYAAAPRRPEPSTGEAEVEGDDDLADIDPPASASAPATAWTRAPAPPAAPSREAWARPAPPPAGEPLDLRPPGLVRPGF